MNHWDAIYNIGLDNYGIVTSCQASAITDNANVELPRWAASGRLERLGVGVYKLATWMPTPYDIYAEAVALVGKGAYLYGEAVLAINDLALVNPRTVNVAIARRVRRRVPSWIKVVNVQDGEATTSYFGILGQALPLAFKACRGKVPISRLRAAVDDAAARGLILRDECDAIRRELA